MYACHTPRGVILPKDVARQETKCVHSEWLWVTMRGQWDDTPSEPESSGGDNEEEDQDEE
jgi:hypothetical protein